MNIIDINKRRRYLSSDKYSSKPNRFVLEGVKFSNNTSEIEDILNSWKSLNINEEFAFSEAMEITSEFLENANKSNRLKVLNILKEEVIPSVKNLKKAKKVINSSFIPNESLNRLLETYLGCDRVLNNQDKLNKLGFNDIFKEGYIDDDISKEICIEKACDLIDGLKVPYSVKVNLALENVLYSFAKNGIKCDDKTILENVTNYFVVRELSENDIDKIQSVLIESPLYEDTNKSGIMYLFELSRTNIPNKDFGLPDERKYPMSDEKHVRLAIKFFNSVDPEKEKELAKNINAKIKQFGIADLNVGKNNRFKLYFSNKKKVVKEGHSSTATSYHSGIGNTNPDGGDEDFNSIKVAYAIKNKEAESDYATDATSSTGKKIETTKPNDAQIDLKTDLSAITRSYSTQNKNEDEDTEHDGVPDDQIVSSSVKAEFSLFDYNKKKILQEKAKEKKNNPKKEIVKQTGEKGIKAAIEKLFTQSPDSIVEGVPDILNAIRIFICMGSIAIPVAGPVIALVGLFTNHLLNQKFKRPQIEKILKKYKKEQDRLDSKYYMTDDENKKKKLEAYKKEIDDAVYKLESYRDNLYSSSEIEERDRQLYESYNELEDDLDNLELNEITPKEYFDYYHNSMIGEVYKAINLLQVFLKDKEYKPLYDSKVIQLTDPNTLRDFETISISKLPKVMNYDKVSVTIARFMPQIYSNSEDRDTEKLLELRSEVGDICDKIQDSLDEKYIIYFDGTDDVYNIMVELLNPISGNESGDGKHIVEQMALLYGIYEETKNIYGENKADKVLESFDKIIAPNTVDYVLEVCKDAAEIIDPEKASNKLKVIKENIKGTDYSSALLKDKLNKGVCEINKTKAPAKSKTNIEEYYKLSNINSELDSLLELSAMSNIKMAALKVKKKIQMANDKQNEASKKLDSSIEKMDEDLRNATSNAVREKIVKGRILPKASTIIKGGIVAGTAAAINPAIAVVGAIGAIAMSKIASRNEKQYILDEIDIQLKIVDRKIQLAENNNDMKSLEQLFKLQKNLTRERQRIFYNMKATYPPNAN